MTGFTSGLSIGKESLITEREESLITERDKNGKLSELTSILSSPLISDITVTGRVSNVSGRNITLTENEENLTIPVKEGLKAISFISPEQKVKIEDLQIGDYLNIFMRVSKDGEIEATRVIIIPF